MYVSPKEAQEHYGVSNKTLQRWDKDKKIKSIRTNGNHRRYEINNIQAETKYIYARVSSSKQKEDLQRQIKFIQEKCGKIKVIKDIGSGINFKRKGFQFILEQVFEGNIKEVTIASKDRLVRFGYEFIEQIFKRFGAKLICLNHDKFKSVEQELAEDLLAVTSIFTARYYGSRKYKLLPKTKDLPKQKT